MKITTTISDSDVADVVEYCRATGTDLQGRMQQELNKFVFNAHCQMVQRKLSKKDKRAFKKKFMELHHGE